MPGSGSGPGPEASHREHQGALVGPELGSEGEAADHAQYGHGAGIVGPVGDGAAKEDHAETAASVARALRPAARVTQELALEGTQELEQLKMRKKVLGVRSTQHTDYAQVFQAPSHLFGLYIAKQFQQHHTQHSFAWILVWRVLCPKHNKICHTTHTLCAMLLTQTP